MAGGMEERKFFLVFAIFALVGLIIMGCLSQGGSSGQSGPSGSQVTPALSTVPVAENKTGSQIVNESIAAAVADGTYSKDVTYAYHSGTNTVDFSVTVANDVVTAVSVAPVGNMDPMSQRIVGGFTAALPALVVGQKIEDINLPRNVGGSSLTSAAFQSYVTNLVATGGKG